MEEEKSKVNTSETKIDYTETIHRTINENSDSLEIGTPGKSGCIKIYGSYDNAEEFKKKIDNAKEVREYANANISVNI